MLKSIASRSTCCLRPSNVAALDRYTAIRTFFRQQITPPLPRAHASVSKPRSRYTQRYTHTTLWTKSISPKLRLSSTRNAFVLTSSRAFTTPPQSSEKLPTGSNISANLNDTTEKIKEEEPSGTQQQLPLARDHENYSRFFRRLALSLPHLHRPTRDDFLNVATGFWQRLRIRFKWFTVRGFRKFNADDISAFITWFLMSQTLWILVGT